jgi:hypothetical protein
METTETNANADHSAHDQSTVAIHNGLTCCQDEYSYSHIC